MHPTNNIGQKMDNMLHQLESKHIHTVFIRIKAELKYTQGLKYMPGNAAEWMKKCLGLFKRWVPTLLNLINVKIVPYIMEN